MVTKGIQEFEGFDPRTKELATFRLVLADLEKISRYAPSSKLTQLYCVEHIATKPSVAFEGLRTVDAKFGDPREYVTVPDPDGLCLCGLPPSHVVCRSQEGQDTKPDRTGQTFCVFVDSEFIIRDWDWIVASQEYSDRPQGWANRFDRLIWSKS